MPRSVGRLPAVDPTNDARVAFADVDWDLLTSTDRFVSQPTNSPPDNTGLALDFTAAGKLFVGFGDRDNNTEGKVWSNTAPFTGGTWVNESTGAGVTGWPATPGRAMGVLAHVNSVGAQTIFAGVRGNGLYRKTGSAWTQVNATIAGTGTDANKEQVNFHADGQYVWCYDPLQGLFRSDAYGDAGSWTLVWSKLSGSVRHAGHMRGVGDDLIVSTASEVWVVKNATTGTLNANGTTASGSIAATQLASATLTKPGPITVSPAGDLYVTMVQGATALMRALGPISGFTASTAFTDLANDDYRRACGFPLGIAVGQDNTIYLSLDGNGHYVGRWT